MGEGQRAGLGDVVAVAGHRGDVRGAVRDCDRFVVAEQERDRDSEQGRPTLLPAYFSTSLMPLSGSSSKMKHAPCRPGLTTCEYLITRDVHHGPISLRSQVSCVVFCPGSMIVMSPEKEQVSVSVDRSAG